MTQEIIKCSICGCHKYTKCGNTSGGKWLFECSNGHRWAMLSMNEPFPFREDDYYHPKNYAVDLMGRYMRKDDPMAMFGGLIA